MNSICFNLLKSINQRLAAPQSFSKIYAGFKRRYVSAYLITPAILGLTTSHSLASQDLVNVDVMNGSGGYTFSGAGVLGNAGDIWNEISGSKQSLVDSAGNTTVVGFTISGVGGAYSDTGGSAPANDPVTAGLLTDYLFVNAGTMTYQITGLLPNSPYNLVVYSAGDQTDQSATFSGAITTVMGPVSRGAFVLGANYGQNTSAVSDANGTLNFSTSASGFHGFNGLQIAGDFPANITVTGYATVPIGGQRPVTITIPATANQSQAFTFQLTNSNPSALSLPGAVNNVLNVVFPQGGASSQVVMVQGLALGTTTLLGNSPAASLAITTIPTSGLIGHWLAGQQDLTDTSGYSPAGTHDGIAASGSFGSDPGFNSDVPPGFTGSSADLGLNGCMIQVQNTSQANDGANYVPTFDNLISQQMTITFWAKFDANTTVGSWQPYMSKRGEEAAWQIRTAADQPIASFTVRGTLDGNDEFDSPTTVKDNNWHHFVCSRDGVTGQRKLFIDGHLSGNMVNDFGSYSLDPDAYLILGGKWTQQSGTGGSAGSQFYGELYDVRIYAEALNGSQVQNLFSPNANNIIAFADTSVVNTGRSGSVSLSIPDGANASQSVSITVTNTSGLISFPGYSGTVFTVTFPAGAPNTLALPVVAGTTEGSAQLGFGATSLNSASVDIFVSGPHLIGEWGTNSAYADVSGYTNFDTAMGTHNGVPVGGGPVNFSADVPNSKPGESLDFSAGDSGLLITNTSVADSGYRPTFDDLVNHQFSIACWVKESTAQNWTAFAAKRGDDDTGYQLRRFGSNNGASVTIRDSTSEDGDMGGNITVVNDGHWHHVCGVWDGYAGVRQLYVDGILDTNITADFAPFCLAKGYHLILGAQENRGVGEGISLENFVSGKIYDLRVYNYPLTPAQVTGLATLGAVQVAGNEIFSAGNTNAITVSIPNGANQNAAVTVSISSGNTGVASVVGAVANVDTLTFAVGGPLTQTVNLVGVGGGKTSVTASSAGLSSGTLPVIIFAPTSPQLVGHWLTGSQSLADSSGFTPAGTHDGVAVGLTPGSYGWDADVPPGYNGYSLDLTANGSGGQVALMVTNTSMSDGNYQVTFDNLITNKFSVSFWAKGYTEGTWDPFVTKNGESTGWQYRMNPNQNDNPSFTLRGTAGPDDVWGAANNVLNDGNWHQYTGTFDSQTGYRTIYVDGKPQLIISGDTGGVTPTPNNHMMIGAKDDSGFTGWFNGQLFDVRIYNYALSDGEVQTLLNPPAALAISVNNTNVPAGDTVPLVVTIPSGANATQAVTVLLTDNAPGVATIVGGINNTLTLTFASGALPSQTVSLITVGPGSINITATMASSSTGLTSPGVVYTKALIGHWLTGTADLTDKSGFTPAGTHDGFVVGANPGSLAFSSDLPSGFSGESLDLTANGSGADIGVAITNSSSNDSRYDGLFDNGMSSAFTVAFWAKGTPGTFNPYVSKAGENNIGWEARIAYTTYAFTIRGTPGDDNGSGNVNAMDGNWHQVTAVWDGVTGNRELYVDGVLDPSVDFTGDYGPMYLAPAEHLAIGARENSSGWENAWFDGLLYDVRVYNYALTPTQVFALQSSSTAVKLTVTSGPGNTVILSWPGSATGYVLQSSRTVNGVWSNSSLTPTSVGGQNVATDSATNSSTFYRLIHTGN